MIRVYILFHMLLTDSLKDNAEEPIDDQQSVIQVQIYMHRIRIKTIGHNENKLFTVGEPPFYVRLNGRRYANYRNFQRLSKYHAHLNDSGDHCLILDKYRLCGVISQYQKNIEIVQFNSPFIVITYVNTIILPYIG